MLILQGKTVVGWEVKFTLETAKEDVNKTGNTAGQTPTLYELNGDNEDKLFTYWNVYSI